MLSIRRKIGKREPWKYWDRDGAHLLQTFEKLSTALSSILFKITSIIILLIYFSTFTSVFCFKTSESSNVLKNIPEDIEVTPECYDVDGVRAYSVGGTPADCVKVALEFLMPEKPDVVFSGINSGYNTGIDILYSGTVGAAMEALANGIRSFAFSNKNDTSWETADAYLISIVKELLNENLSMDRIWNVNFPGCKLSECKGILRDRIPAKHQFYQDDYVRTNHADGSFSLRSKGVMTEKAEEGTDISALLNNYISIGSVRCAALGYQKD